MKTPTIAIANQKGGVTKTTTAITLAHYFAARGRHTLIVDLDGQGQAATYLGLEKSNALYRLLVDEQPMAQVATQARPNLDLICNDKTSERVGAFMMQASFREYAIHDALEKVDSYELIFLDTPPSTNVLHVSSLVAADYIIIPTLLDYGALEGVAEILTTLAALKRIPGVVPPQLIGVLPAQYERVTAETLRKIRELQSSLGSNQLLPPIPKDTRVREASSRGVTIWEYAPDSPAAIGYQDESVPFKNSRGGVGGYLHLAEIVERMIPRT